ncbi:zinc ABC transporter substrate-binding protein [Aetokthonos hydrillicola Thurmond2011]|jgi:manganese/iron transport system substrate-binding protein|uniref:Zinc ABC transporter substrate-binding protein n=1 Tax=Aetokthonos hydrillicola Thurmond2011 TaxID=2712845 RepID=A0AAP5M9R4_9CYAN|nr:zinc ABC transporter substrate-binding protein [Aetokthonos hydrillicola]MBO3458973.1 zinc ABC transporter solute-binding protein [Aetokthonos hydrillicola CCALA 1050]MBW4589081.1 zinc ABC transporter substrate-binding protein [Aetokthonos hydrillicola CCALA 1050]MDR9894963.1 zinc ABC transporter substrate-binding protein [Aetokthonos hydrillicola Thurmond2011]
MSKKLSLNRNLCAAFVVFTVGLVGCNNFANVANTSYTTTSSDGSNNNLPRVIATTGVLCDLTKQIAQETINLVCLTSPNTNPRTYQPKPEDRKAIEQAKLIFFNGYNFEQGALKLIKANKKPVPNIGVAHRAVPQPLQMRKDGRTIPDPYVWHNAKHGIKMVEVISTYLEKVFPKNASLYSTNAEKIKNELTQLDGWIKSRISSIPPKQRKLVTTDNTMNYYVQAYGLSSIGSFEGINVEEKATNPSVKKLVKNITQAKVPTIFAANTIDPNLTNTVAKEAKVKVSKRQLFADDLGDAGSEGDTYQNMMIANTRTIVEGLGGTYLIFQPKGK